MASSFHFEDSRDERVKNRAEEKCATTTNETPSAGLSSPTDRRAFLQGAAAAAAALAMPRWARAHPSDLDAIRAEIEKRHDESVKRLQDWIRQPSIAAEGEEEIGSPHFPQIVRRPEVMEALRNCLGIFMPSASQGLDGEVTMTLGAKGVIECELLSSGERWGRGPRKDVHSSNKARLDSPAWHLVEALATLVSPDGNDPAIEGFAAKARPVSEAEKKMIAEAARRMSEAEAKKLLGVEHWVHDVNWNEALELLMSRPTVNIEGLVGGYTGPGGKTILPGKATAKLDLRLVPDMTAAEALAALKAHLAKKGFGDIEVRMTGGYDPNSTRADAALIRVETDVYRKGGIDPVILPRSAGSWPGYVFTGEPLHLAAGPFGLGHGSGAHAPDEYYVIESKNPKVHGMDGAVRSFAELLYALAQAN